jgi:hypothetical protein
MLVPSSLILAASVALPALFRVCGVFDQIAGGIE